jgi:hypothetical protein
MDEFSFSDDENVENGKMVSKEPVSSVVIKKTKASNKRQERRCEKDETHHSDKRTVFLGREGLTGREHL